MTTIHDWLRSTRAGDVMTADVACLRASDRLADAMNLFLREQISGAPIVDDQGVCIGVLSATDFVHFEEKRERTPVSGSECHRPSFDSWSTGAEWWRTFGRITQQIQPRLDDCVREYMTRDVVSVTEHTPLGVVLRMMIDAHVHRVLVLDGSRRILGIVTTMDILAATVEAGHRDPMACTV